MEFGIPSQTLRDRISGEIDPDDFGRETPFLEEEELGLVEITAVKARLGYGV
ncbi:hypothetical protein DPMN_091128 [Dreissena polymorpha]|uniref:Uncharacterized protein n=1 Tax=Dreissena polymorpha TaxID=45954 RepID=A0A9D4KZV0_DREPO|nr:hypothetical protein DPMN_091128 [Dreissena polymorpha]